MSRKYTAQEIRERAEIVGKAFLDFQTAQMLLQAADMMESKKRYEYSEKKKDGEIDIQHQESLKEARSLKFFKDSTIVRREVGEWEEVEDGK